MKKQIAKSISTVSLLVLLSGSAVNVYASGGTCSVPSCRPKKNIAMPTTTLDVTPSSTQNPAGQVTATTALPEDVFSFALFMARWVVSFSYWY